MPNYPSSLDHIGPNIRAERVRRGLRMADLAEKADMNASYLSDVENSRNTPGIAILLRIANALDVDLDSLLEPQHEPLPAA